MREEALKKMLRKESCEYPISDEEDQHSCSQSENLSNDEKPPNFSYTSAHADDLAELKNHALQLESIEWRDLDIRHPILSQK